MKKRYISETILLGLSVLGGCGGQQGTSSADSFGSRPEVEVYVVPAGSAATGDVYTAPSTLAVEHEADLLAEEPERLVEVLADQGQRVKRGQVLARLDDSHLRKQVEEDRAGLQMLEVEAREAETLRQASEVELQRQADLRKYGIGNQRDYDKARFNLEAMRQEVEKARFGRDKARARVEAEEIRLSRLQLKAPFDGIVSRRYARVGQFLLKDDKVLRVTELRPLLVRFTVPESLRSAAGTGAMVEVRATEESDGAIRARVVRTSYVVDAASGTVECIARLVEPVPRQLVPGMAVDVTLRGTGTKPAATAVWVPRSAVRRAADGSAEVFAISSERLQTRRVQLGLETTANVQVLKGIVPGDRIVAQVSTGLQDGMSVRIRP